MIVLIAKGSLWNTVPNWFSNFFSFWKFHFFCWHMIMWKLCAHVSIMERWGRFKRIKNHFTCGLSQVIFFSSCCQKHDLHRDSQIYLRCPCTILLTIDETWFDDATRTGIFFKQDKPWSNCKSIWSWCTGWIYNAKIYDRRNNGHPYSISIIAFLTLVVFLT